MTDDHDELVNTCSNMLFEYLKNHLSLKKPEIQLIADLLKEYAENEARPYEEPIILTIINQECLKEVRVVGESTVNVTIKNLLK